MSDVETNDLVAVISGVQLENVRLLQSNVKTRLRDPRRVPTANLVLAHGTKVLHRNEAGFLVGAMVEAKVVAADQPEAEPLVNMDVTLELRYSLADQARFDDQVLEEFARLNGAFNAWPYWREYFQMTAARMQLPPLILPVFRIDRPKPPAEEAPSAAPTGFAGGGPDIPTSSAPAVRRKGRHRTRKR